MKKLKMFVWTLVALFVLAGCNQEEIPVSPTTQPAEGRTVTATATLPGAVSRLALTDEGNLMKVDWAETGEKFTVMLPDVWYGASDIIYFNQTEGDQFTGTLPAEATGPFYAFYPAVELSKGAVFSLGNVKFNFTAQHGDWQNAKLPMYAVSQDGTDFEFHHLSAMLKFNIHFKDYTPSASDKMEFTFVKSTGTILDGAVDLTNEIVSFLQKETPYAESIVVASEHVTIATDGTASFYLYLPPMAKDETFDLYCTKISSEGASEMYHAEVKLQKDVHAGSYYSVTREMQPVTDTYLRVVDSRAFVDAIKVMFDTGNYTQLAFKPNSETTSEEPITSGVVGMPVYAVASTDDNKCLEIHTSAPHFTWLGTASFLFMDWSTLEKLDLSGINTAEVTSMRGMFYRCQSLTTLDLSSFNTAKVTDMSYMFYGCQSLTTLNLSSFNTAKVLNMSNMFDGCKSLTSLGLSSFNTAMVTNMSNMFLDCQSLTSLDLSSFNTAEVTSMYCMFEGCQSLTTLDLSSFNTAEVTSMYCMFYGCSSLQSLDLSSFNTVKVTDMSYMFEGCQALTTLDLSSFNTAMVTSMRNMFYGCSSLESLDLSRFNTSMVTDMGGMFYGCSSLKTLTLSNSFTTAKVTDMSGMFSGCSALTSLDLSSFNTSKVTDMGGMFDGCSSLTTLDLSSFEFSNNVNVNAIFYNLGNETSPTSIYVTQAGEAYLQGKPIYIVPYFNLIVGTPPSTAD